MKAKEERFCQQYVVDLNGTQAAIRTGYSKKTAAQIATEILRKPHIKARVEDLQEELRNKTGLSAELIIEELRSLGFWSIKDFIDSGNEIVDLSELSRKLLRPVTGIKIIERTFEDVTTKTTELKLADKRAALVDLGRHLGIFKEDNEQKTIKIKVTRK